MTTTRLTTTTLTTTTSSEWLLPCPICQGPMYVYAWCTDGWTDCAHEHRAGTDSLAYERARRAQRETWASSPSPRRAAS